MTTQLRFRGTQPPRAQVLAPVEQDGEFVLRLYDVIDSWGGAWGVSAEEFAAALDAVPRDAQRLRLHVNSPGGEVFEGVAILNQLRQHPAPVTAVVDGLAASAASFIACGVDELVMAPNSQLMIHDAWGICIGSAADMRDLAALLDKLSDNVAAVYAAKAGGDTADWRSAMLAESWYSADEAVAAGLADSVLGAPAGDDTAAEASFDLSVFRYQGRQHAPAPSSLARPAAASAGFPHRLAASLRLAGARHGLS